MENTPKTKKQPKTPLPQYYPFNRNLPREEYDFSNIPEGEWRIASEWEFEREVARYINELTIIAGGEQEADPIKEIPPWLSNDKDNRAFWAQYGIQAPLKPSKEDIATKKHVPVKAFKPIVPELTQITDLSLQSLNSKLNYHRFRKKKYGPRWYDSRLFIAEIDPQKPRSQIIKEFSEFIDSFVPEKRAGAKSNTSTILMDLAIYRIMAAGYTRRECIAMCQWMSQSRIPDGGYRTMGQDGVASGLITKALNKIPQELKFLYEKYYNDD